jgi:hypothetical protein
VAKHAEFEARLLKPELHVGGLRALRRAGVVLIELNAATLLLARLKADQAVNPPGVVPNHCVICKPGVENHAPVRDQPFCPRQ